MLEKIRTTLRKASRGMLIALLVAFFPQAYGQSLEWDAVKFFQYNIENVVVKAGAPGSGTWTVRIIFSVTNPDAGTTWNIRDDLPFTSTGANLTFDIAWDPFTDFTNTGSANQALTQVSTKSLGAGAAMPVQVRGLQGPAGKAAPCVSLAECPGAASFVNRYWVEAPITPVKFIKPVTTGRVAIEGRPVCNGVTGYAACPSGPTTGVYVNIPVTSAVASFAFGPADPLHAKINDPRRPIVDIAKCKGCHDGTQHGNTVVPRLGLHGGNRNENLGLCVMCHNANQTDVPYRTLTTPAGTAADARVSGDEVSIDFKRMIHSIHAGGFREKSFVVIGFQSSINDFSHVRFPKPLRDCMACHVESNGKGTFELPLQSAVLGTTVNTRSVYKVAQPQTGVPGSGQFRQINVDPNDDDKITPIAAVCSGCHDKAEVQSHMISTGGASFKTTQAKITGGVVRERCVSCHGPGKEEDVRRAHQIGTGGGNDD
jgi:OmcA/MtrC family decaheme c-type cytochrome